MLGATEATGLLAKMSGPASEVTARLKSLRDELTGASWAIRTIANLAAVSMTVAGAFSVLTLLSLKPLQALIEVYTLLAGLLAISIEGTFTFRRFQEADSWAYKFAPGLFTLTGRATFYIFFGSLLVAQFPSLLDFGVGCYVVFAGITLLLAGARASHKLNALRGSLADEAALRKAFKKADKDGNNALSVEELAKLCEELGAGMERKELEATLFMLDKDRNGKVEFEEFFGWWKSHGESAMLAKYFQAGDKQERNFDV